MFKRYSFLNNTDTVSYTHLDVYKRQIVGIEPTGHYWFDLGAYLEDEGILLVMVKDVYKRQVFQRLEAEKGQE